MVFSRELLVAALLLSSAWAGMSCASSSGAQKRGETGRQSSTIGNVPRADLDGRSWAKLPLPPQLGILIRFDSRETRRGYRWIRKRLEIWPEVKGEWAPYRRIVASMIDSNYNATTVGEPPRLTGDQLEGLDAGAPGFIAYSSAGNSEWLRARRSNEPVADSAPDFQMLNRLILPADAPAALVASLERLCRRPEKQERCRWISRIEAHGGWVWIDGHMRPRPPSVQESRRPELPEVGIDSDVLPRKTAAGEYFRREGGIARLYVGADAGELLMFPRTINLRFQTSEQLIRRELASQLAYLAPDVRETAGMSMAIQLPDAGGAEVRLVQSRTKLGRRVVEQSGGRPELPDVQIDDPVVDIAMPFPGEKARDASTLPGWMQSKSALEILRDHLGWSAPVGLLYYPTAYWRGVTGSEMKQSPGQLFGSVLRRIGEVGAVRIVLGAERASDDENANPRLRGGMAVATRDASSWPVDTWAARMEEFFDVPVRAKTTEVDSDRVIYKFAIGGGFDIFSGSSEVRTRWYVDTNEMDDESWARRTFGYPLRSRLARLDRVWARFESDRRSRRGVLRIGPVEPPEKLTPPDRLGAWELTDD